MTKRRSFIYVSMLFIMDQVIKLYIYLNHMEKDIDIIKGFLMFRPKFNRDFSWINSLFQFGIGLTAHIIISAIVLLGLIFTYDFIKTKKHINNTLNLAFVFIISGAICSLIDKLIWGGSLDYIYLVGFFIFDLKDVYISVFEVLLILSIVRSFNRFKKLDEKRILRELWIFVKCKYFRVGKNIDNSGNKET